MSEKSKTVKEVLSINYADAVGLSVLVGGLKMVGVEPSTIGKLIEFTEATEKIGKDAEKIQKKIFESYDVEILGGKVRIAGHPKSKEIQKELDAFNEVEYELNSIKCLNATTLNAIIEQNTELNLKNIKALKKFLLKD